MKSIFHYLSVLSALFIITPVILLHETAHMVTALGYGMTVESYNVGIGPSLLHTTLQGIEYHWRLIPFGGYVSITNLAEFPLFAKVVVISAGCLINLLSALFFSFCFPKGKLWLKNAWSSCANMIFNKIMMTFYLPYTRAVPMALSELIDAKTWELPKPILFLALVSIEFGLFNLLPFTYILDGGKLTTYLLTPLLGATFVDILSKAIYLWILLRWIILDTINEFRLIHLKRKKEIIEGEEGKRMLEEAATIMKTDTKAGIRLIIAYTEKYESVQFADSVKQEIDKEFPQEGKKPYLGFKQVRFGPVFLY